MDLTYKCHNNFCNSHQKSSGLVTRLPLPSSWAARTLTLMLPQLPRMRQDVHAHTSGEMIAIRKRFVPFSCCCTAVLWSPDPTPFWPKGETSAVRCTWLSPASFYVCQQAILPNQLYPASAMREVAERHTLRARLRSSSRARRSFMFRVVTYLPSRPEKGDVLMRNDILTVGSSTVMVGSGIRKFSAHTVSPILAVARPAENGTFS
jgi:hypothetical protein